MLACCSLVRSWTVGWHGRCSWALLLLLLPLCISLSLTADSKAGSQSCRAESTKWLRKPLLSHWGGLRGAAAHGLNQVLWALGKLWLKKNSSRSRTLARRRKKNRNLCQMNAQKNMKIWSEHRFVWINNSLPRYVKLDFVLKYRVAISRAIARLDTRWAEPTRYLDFS